MPSDDNKIKALNRFLDPEDKLKLEITYNPNTETYEAKEKRFYVLTPDETKAKYREVAVKAWDAGITRFLEGSHVFPEEYITDYSYFVDEAKKQGIVLKVSDNPLIWWIKRWIAQNATEDMAREFNGMENDDGELDEENDENKFSQVDLDGINYDKKTEKEDMKDSKQEVLDNYEGNLELKKVLHKLFRSGEVGFDQKGFFDAVVKETDPGLLLSKDNLTHQVNYDGKVFKIFYV